MIFDVHNHIGFRRGEYASVEELLRLMDKNHIDKAVVFTQCETPDNKYVARSVEKYRDRLVGFAYLDPWRFDTEEELSRCITEYGFMGVKLNPTKQAFALDRHSLVDQIFEICGKKGFPILSHGASDLFSMPSKFGTMARLFPHVNLIMAHMGLPDAFDTALRLVKENKNLYVDIAGVHPRAIKRAVDEVGAEKILMGTDSPWGLYELSLIGINEATDDPKNREMIMSGNIKRILKL
jgi:hypothetical protein